MKARRAITLMEMVFVVVIMATLLAVSLPRLAGTGDRTALTTTGRDIARMANMARQSAVSMQAETRLVFSMKDKAWKLELPREEGARNRRGREQVSSWEQTNPLHARVRFVEFLQNGDPVKGEELIVRFLPNGTSTGATIILANTRDRRLTVDIERATGRTAAYNGEPMKFADLVAMAGGDPTKFAGVEASTMNLALQDGEKPRFYSIERSGDERVAAYTDAASRIMGRVNREHERQQQQSGAPQRNDAPSRDNPQQRQATPGGGRGR